MNSSDLPELLGLTDCLQVLDEGRLAAMLTAVEATPMEVPKDAPGLAASVKADARMSDRNVIRAREQR